MIFGYSLLILTLFPIILTIDKDKSKMPKAEQILDKKIDPKTNEQLYLVKWKGNALATPTWQPIENIGEQNKALVDKFEKQYGAIATTPIGKVFIPRRKEELKPEPKSIKSIKIRKDQPGPCTRSHPIKPNPMPNPELQKQNLEAIEAQPETPSKPILNDIEQLLEYKEPQTLHRRNSIDKWAYKESNFMLVNKKTSNSNGNSNTKEAKEQEEALRSHRKRESQRENVAETKKFTPIIVTGHRVTRRNSIKEFKQLMEQEKDSPRKSKMKQNTATIPKIDIIGMRRKKDNNQYQFYAKQNGKAVWLGHGYMLDNYSRQLCLYYEKSLTLN